MRIYDFAGAPNPRKLRVYLAEKGLKIPFESVDLMSGQNRTPEFLKKNPLGGLPVLEFDNGTCLSESLAIIEYFEELHPDPPMIGTTPIERARVRSLERVVELGALFSVAMIFQNTHPLFAERINQSAEAAESGRKRLAIHLEALDESIDNNPFVAGEQPTIADCTLLATLAFAEFAGESLDPSYGNLARWYAAFRQRPSAQL